MTRARLTGQEGPEGERTSALAEERAGRPRHDVLWASGSAQLALPDRGRAVIGRSVQADLVVDHPSLSRVHAAIEIGEGIVWSDLGSSHGTKIRGHRLTEGERVQVGWGEPVELGSVIAVARAGGAPARGAAEQPAAHSSKDQLERWIELVAATEMSVLLLGETGVGKGFYARQIHERSARASSPLLHINCAALSEHLLESELFGHERGAFTGATQAKPGLLESASGGTVFLDEVGELTLDVQAKLLVALERREVTRVGGLQPRPFDVRLVAATNRDIDTEVSGARFRRDLYFRLAGLPLVVPPLRERQSEVVALAVGFLNEAAARMRRPAPAIADDAMDALRGHTWPGNVRELMTVMDRVVLLSVGTLTATQLIACIQPTGRLGGSHPGAGLPSATAALAVPAKAQPPRRGADDLRQRIVAALEQCAGNQSRAADLLGVSRRTLIHRMDELELPRPRRR